MQKRNFFILLLPVLLFSGQSSLSQEFPSDEWIFNEDAQKEGWSALRLRDFRQFLIDSSNTTGFLIIHKGKVVFTYGDVDEVSYVASVRKSILSILYGRHVQNGQINLNKTLAELRIDDVTPLLPLEKRSTIKDLLSARSGVFLNGSNKGDQRKYAPPRGSKKPGEFWLYSNWDFNVAGHIFEQETGREIYDAIESDLAVPIQMEDWDRTLQKKSGDTTISRFPAYHIWLSTRDMARIGLLMLNKGKWKNKQIIPEKWVDEMIKMRTPYEEISRNLQYEVDPEIKYGYGYMWWPIAETDSEHLENGYSALGAYGQSITVYPAIDVVVAMKTDYTFRRSTPSAKRSKILRMAADLYQKK